MLRRIVLVSMVVIAVATILSGVAWETLRPPESYWSPQQAQEYQDAFRAVHAAQDAVKSDSRDEKAAEFAAAEKRYNEIRADLASARDARKRMGRFATIAGFAVLLSALALWHFWLPAATSPDEQN
jgi:hypothetical protein